MLMASWDTETNTTLAYCQCICNPKSYHMDFFDMLCRNSDTTLRTNICHPLSLALTVAEIRWIDTRILLNDTKLRSIAQKTSDDLFYGRLDGNIARNLLASELPGLVRSIHANTETAASVRLLIDYVMAAVQQIKRSASATTALQEDMRLALLCRIKLLEALYESARLKTDHRDAELKLQSTLVCQFLQNKTPLPFPCLWQVSGPPRYEY